MKYKLPAGVNRDSAIKDLKKTWGDKFQANLKRFEYALSFLPEKELKLLKATRIGERAGFVKEVIRALDLEEEKMIGVAVGDSMYAANLNAARRDLQTRLGQLVGNYQDKFATEQQHIGSVTWADFDGENPDIEVVDGDPLEETASTSKDPERDEHGHGMLSYPSMFPSNPRGIDLADKPSPGAGAPDPWGGPVLKS